VPVRQVLGIISCSGQFNSVQHFNTAQYLLTILPVLISWWAGNLFAADLSLLGAEDAANFDDRLKTTPVHTMILRRFLSLGCLWVILASIPLQHPIPDVNCHMQLYFAPVVVAYFVLGIILLSLTRYITLETSWWQARLRKHPDPAPLVCL